MYSKLIELIQTTDDLLLLHGEIDALKKALYSTKENAIEEVLDNEFRKNIKERILEDTASKKIDWKQYIEGLEAEIEKINTVKLTLAFEPNGKTFSAIYQWFITNIGVNTVLDIYYNPAIVGGASVSFNGKYYDGTILKKLNEI